MRELTRLRKQARRTSDDARVWADLGLLALTVGEADEGVAALRNAVELGTLPFERCLEVGRALGEVGLHKVAVRAFERATALQGSSPEACGYLGLALAHSGRVDEGIAGLRRACELGEEDPNARFVLARWLLAAGQRDEAVGELRRVLALDSNHVAARTELGSCLRSMGHAQAAISELRLVTQSAPHDVRGRTELALALHAIGKRGESIELLRGIEGQGATLAAADHVALGRAYDELGEPRAAVDHLRAALRADPQSPEAHIDLGEMLLRIADGAGAVAVLRRARELAPDSAKAHYQLGLALKHLKSYQDALSALARAADLAPHDAAISRELQETVLLQAARWDGDRTEPGMGGRRGPPALTGPMHPLQQTQAAFSGNLTMFRVPDLLEFLRINRRSGRLLLTSPEGLAEIRLRAGWLTGAASPRTPLLGELLVRSGSITQTQLREVVQDQLGGTGDDLLGMILLRKRVVDVRVLQDALAEQVRCAVREIVVWTAGSFVFEPTEEPEDDASSSIMLDPQNVLLEVFCEHDEAGRDTVPGQ